MKNLEIKAHTYDIPQTPENCLNLHFRLGVIGPSGCGKTNAVVSYVKNFFKNKNIFNTICLISPTGCINKKTGLRGECKWEGVADEEYQDFSEANLMEILENQTNRIIKHKNYLKDSKIYKKFIKDGLKGLYYDEILRLYENTNFEKPVAPYGTEHFPTILIILDDCTDATRKPFLSNFYSKSRHYNASIMCLSQHYSHMSRALRNNLSAMMLFKTNDEKLLKTLHEQQCAGDMKQEEFLKMFKELEKRHEFIFMDWNAKDNNKRYIKNFGD